MVFSTLLRAVVILLAAWIGMRSGYFSFPGIIIGILGLKISAYFHAYTNVYITKKLYKKGIVCLILLALILFARHEIMKDYDEPNVVQNVVEMIVEKMDAMVVSNMGIHAKKYLNYVEALMAFIFLSNISGLFGLRPPTADFGTT